MVDRSLGIAIRRPDGKPSSRLVKGGTPARCVRLAWHGANRDDQGRKQSPCAAAVLRHTLRVTHVWALVCAALHTATTRRTPQNSRPARDQSGPGSGRHDKAAPSFYWDRPSPAARARCSGGPGGGRRRAGACDSSTLDRAAALDNPHQHDDPGHYEQQVDEAAHRVGREHAESPQHDEDEEDSRQHGFLG